MTHPGADTVAQLFSQGLEFHGQGELNKAMQTYEQVLRLEPKHFEALHHVGIVAFQIGNYDMAAGFFRSALAVNPDDAAAHNNLGNALREMRHLEDALLSYERSLVLNAEDANTHFNRGVALQTLGRLEEALHSYDQALELNPGDDQAWTNHAAVLKQMTRYEAAWQSVEQALAVNPHNAEAYNHGGAILRELERLVDAEECFQRALALFPDYADAHCNLGRLYLSRERFEDALACFDKAIKLHPQLLEAYQQRAIALLRLDRRDESQRDLNTAAALRRELTDAYRKQGQELLSQGHPQSAACMFTSALELDDSDADMWQLHARALNAAGQRESALTSIARALARKPDSADYHLTRGVILRASHQYEAARECYEKVVMLAPRHPGGYTNLGSLLDQLGHPAQALANYERAIALDPECALAYWNRSLVYLRQGDYERGWREYEWRWKAETLDLHKKQRNFPQPAWTGREPLQGKTILLHTEQGLGDVLQFCRYAPLVAQRGARVILEVKKPLATVLETLAGVAQIVIKDDPLPPFDYHIPVMSLPLAFNTTLDTVPSAAPYLASDPAKIAQWKAILGEKRKPRVGVVWAGNPEHLNDHNRSLPLQQLARLLSDRCEFISLQKQVKPSDQALLDSLPMRQVADQLQDFSDTAALCEVLDLVITVDTSVAHLAGALGKPVWILLQAPFEWRWLEHGKDSKWYPSATLYRQPRRGDWESVIDAVAADLEKLAVSF